MPVRLFGQQIKPIAVNREPCKFLRRARISIASPNALGCQPVASSADRQRGRISGFTHLRVSSPSHDCAYSAGSLQADGTRQCVETGTRTLLVNPNRTRTAGVQGFCQNQSKPTPRRRKPRPARCGKVLLECDEPARTPLAFNDRFLLIRKFPQTQE